jgi:hypothetical protein
MLDVNLVSQDMLGHMIHVTPPIVTIHAALRTGRILSVRGGAARRPNVLALDAAASYARAFDTRRCRAIKSTSNNRRGGTPRQYGVN